MISWKTNQSSEPWLQRGSDPKCQSVNSLLYVPLKPSLICFELLQSIYVLNWQISLGNDCENIFFTWVNRNISEMTHRISVLVFKIQSCAAWNHETIPRQSIFRKLCDKVKITWIPHQMKPDLCLYESHTVHTGAQHRPYCCVNDIFLYSWVLKSIHSQTMDRFYWPDTITYLKMYELFSDSNIGMSVLLSNHV